MYSVLSTIVLILEYKSKFILYAAARRDVLFPEPDFEPRSEVFELDALGTKVIGFPVPQPGEETV